MIARTKNFEEAFYFRFIYLLFRAVDPFDGIFHIVDIMKKMVCVFNDE
jgi:hypothetical protein